MNSHCEAARAALARWAEDPALEPPVSGRFEGHLFCLPLDPSDEEKQRFVEACEAIGARALCIGLDFEGKGIVRVLMTSKYYERDSVHEPVADMVADAEVLDRSLEVVRIKLEALATQPGIPLRSNDARAMQERTGFDHYFEFHVRLAGDPTPERDAELQALAGELTRELGVKIPFSCNDMGAKTQRFLNARTYGLGLEESQRDVIDRITAAVTDRGYAVQKVISEYGVFDTNKALDRGWLEFVA